MKRYRIDVYSWFATQRTKLQYLFQRFYYALNKQAIPPPSYYLQFVRTSTSIGRPGKNLICRKAVVKTKKDGSRDYSHYDAMHFLDYPRYENYDYLHGRVRKEDMGSAALYACGVNTFQKAQQIFPETTFSDQVKALIRSSQIYQRQPHYAADIGCGLGSLTALLLACRYKVDAVDPAPIAQQKLFQTIRKFTKKSIRTYKENFVFYSLELHNYMDKIKNSPYFPDTFFLVETIEHIPKQEILYAVKIMKKRGGCRLIITNAIDYHPTYPDGTGWNHITLIDDAYYAELSLLASKKILQAGSHLVLEFT